MCCVDFVIFPLLKSNSSPNMHPAPPPAGCVTNTSSHAIGETYHMGCQSTCVCGGPNQPSCRPRCSFTRGTVTDLSCSERPDLDDPECCVQLVCAVTSTGG